MDGYSDAYNTSYSIARPYEMHNPPIGSAFDHDSYPMQSYHNPYYGQHMTPQSSLLRSPPSVDVDRPSPHIARGAYGESPYRAERPHESRLDFSPMHPQAQIYNQRVDLYTQSQSQPQSQHQHQHQHQLPSILPPVPHANPMMGYGHHKAPSPTQLMYGPVHPNPVHADQIPRRKGMSNISSIRQDKIEFALHFRGFLDTIEDPDKKATKAHLQALFEDWCKTLPEPPLLTYSECLFGMYLAGVLKVHKTGEMTYKTGSPSKESIASNFSKAVPTDQQIYLIQTLRNAIQRLSRDRLPPTLNNIRQQIIESLGTKKLPDVQWRNLTNVLNWSAAFINVTQDVSGGKFQLFYEDGDIWPFVDINSCDNNYSPHMWQQLRAFLNTPNGQQCNRDHSVIKNARMIQRTCPSEFAQLPVACIAHMLNLLAGSETSSQTPNPTQSDGGSSTYGVSRRSPFHATGTTPEPEADLPIDMSQLSLRGASQTSNSLESPLKTVYSSRSPVSPSYGQSGSFSTDSHHSAFTYAFSPIDGRSSVATPTPSYGPRALTATRSPFSPYMSDNSIASNSSSSVYDMHSSFSSHPDDASQDSFHSGQGSAFLSPLDARDEVVTKRLFTNTGGLNAQSPERPSAFKVLGSSRSSGDGAHSLFSTQSSFGAFDSPQSGSQTQTSGFSPFSMPSLFSSQRDKSS